METFKINGRPIGPGHPVYVVTELSANHRQDFDEACALIRAAKRSGADAVKVQTFTADTLTLDSDREAFRVSGGSIWDGKRLYDLYAEAADLPLLERVARTRKPVILSTGMASVAEIAEALDTLCRAIAFHYARAFADCSELSFPQEREGFESARHLYPVRLRPDRLSAGRRRSSGRCRKTASPSRCVTFPSIFSHFTESKAGRKAISPARRRFMSPRSRFQFSRRSPMLKPPASSAS